MPLTPKQITIGPQPIAPGEIAQISFQAPDDARVKTPVVGEGARPVKLWVGRTALEVPTEGPWEVDLPVSKGGLVMLTVQNMLDEPACFSVSFKLEVDVPVEALKPAPEAQALTQRFDPSAEPKTTPADHGLKAGNNEIAVCFMRNEANFLIANLREGQALPADVRFTIIRRLDAVLKLNK